MEEAIKKMAEFRSNLTILYASGHCANKDKKQLRFTLDGGYNIYINSVCTRQTMQPFAAIEYYNDLGGDQID